MVVVNGIFVNGIFVNGIVIARKTIVIMLISTLIATRWILFIGWKKDIFMICSLLKENTVRLDLANHDSPFTFIHHYNPREIAKDNEFVEIVHRKRSDSGGGYWAYMASGSNMGVNVGKTMAFSTHTDALKYFNVTNGVGHWAAVSSAAGSYGFNTLQFFDHDELFLNRWCLRTLPELFIINGTELHACPPQNMYRNKTHTCPCSEQFYWSNCGQQLSAKFEYSGFVYIFIIYFTCLTTYYIYHKIIRLRYRNTLMRDIPSSNNI